MCKDKIKFLLTLLKVFRKRSPAIPPATQGIVFVFLVIFGLFWCAYQDKPINLESYRNLCVSTIQKPEIFHELPSGFIFITGIKEGKVKEWFEILASRPPRATLVRQTEGDVYILMEIYVDTNLDGVPDYFRTYRVIGGNTIKDEFYTDQPTEKIKKSFRKSLTKFFHQRGYKE